MLNDFDGYIGPVRFQRVGKFFTGEDELGMLDRWEPLLLDDGTVFSDSHPVIRDALGQEVLGMECFWTPEDA